MSQTLSPFYVNYNPEYLAHQSYWESGRYLVVGIIEKRESEHATSTRFVAYPVNGEKKLMCLLESGFCEFEGFVGECVLCGSTKKPEMP
jgi:hypothetical protein